MTRYRSLFDPVSLQRPVQPVDPHVETEDIPRLSRQARLTLELLRRGPVTCKTIREETGSERPGARIFDVKRYLEATTGQTVEKTKRETGVYEYELTPMA